MKSIGLGLIAMTLVTGCGSSKSASWSGGDTLQMKAERRAKLQGTWQLPCSSAAEGEHSYNSTLSFENGSLLREEFNTFTGDKCEGGAMSKVKDACSYEVELNEQMEGTLTQSCPEAVVDGKKLPASSRTSQIKISEEENGETKLSLKTLTEAVGGKPTTVSADSKEIVATKVKPVAETNEPDPED